MATSVEAEAVAAAAAAMAAVVSVVAVTAVAMIAAPGIAAKGFSPGNATGRLPLSYAAGWLPPGSTAD